MTGNAPDLRAFAEVARRHGALLYVDDAHGFGVIGERAADEPSPYGAARQQRRPPRRRDLRRARARRRLLQGLLLAARLHRVPDRGQAAAQGRGAAVPLLRAVAGRLAGHRARRLRRQRAPRRRAAQRAARAHRSRAGALDRLDIETPNRSGLPIIEIPLRDHERIDAVGRFLFERGVYVTLAAYPLVPKDEVGFRVQLTAANTVEEVDRADRGARGAHRARRAPQRAGGRRARPAPQHDPAAHSGAAPGVGRLPRARARCCARCTSPSRR